jgi:thiamine pyrophosphokinase
MSRFVILLGGDLVRTPRIDAQVAGARVIAADGGIRHAATLSVEPELWTGDFDSTTDALTAQWAHVPREAFPSAKAKNDGELAADAALARGATSLVLIGAFGGSRADHPFVHLTLGLKLAEQGFPTILTDGRQEGRPLLTGATRFDYAGGTTFSILGFSKLTGLSITGARWPLDRIVMPFGSSLTLSNEVAGDLGVELEDGRALLIAHVNPGAVF